MSFCFFVSDLHGKLARYQKLFQQIEEKQPLAVFMGGDLLPKRSYVFQKREITTTTFLENYFFSELRKLKDKLGVSYPRFLVILGNDDPRSSEIFLQQAEKEGLLEYINEKWTKLKSFEVCGYSYVPPTPFLFKDWEKYDVSCFVDVGCVSPLEGFRSVPKKIKEIKYETIKKDLEHLAKAHNMEKSIMLFHAPPYKTQLDRAALDGQMVDYAPLDVHVGSIAIKDFILEKQPRLTLHGHVHESAGITGSWKQMLGNTLAFSAAHDEPELALVIFDLTKIAEAERLLI
ncbi:MAG: metallophosphoesterase [Candidatus Cloacimonadota bacterium]|nr:metallophosphoesterase [Candidatus Cloacimonadota bacterium]